MDRRRSENFAVLSISTYFLKKGLFQQKVERAHMRLIMGEYIEAGSKVQR